MSTDIKLSKAQISKIIQSGGFFASWLGNLGKKAIRDLEVSKKKKKHDEIVLLGKDNLDAIEVLISKALIDLYINHNEFVLVNNVLREYNEMKKDIKNPETSVEYSM